MITINEKDTDTVEIKLSEILSRKDIHRLTDVLWKYARDSVSPRLLLAADSFRGWYGSGPWWSDLNLDDKCNCKLAFQRAALIGDQNWKEWLQTFVSSSAHGEIKFFPHEDMPHARKLLDSSDESKTIIKH